MKEIKELMRKAEILDAQEDAKELAIEKAREAGLEPEGLDPQPADAMPYRGLAHRADGSPTAAVSGISPMPTATS